MALTASPATMPAVQQGRRIAPARPFTTHTRNAPVRCARINASSAAVPQSRKTASRTRLVVYAQQQSSNGQKPLVPDGSVSVVLLAGGVGKRMGAPIPKQYLELKGQPIATYSLVTFSRMREVSEVVIVCDPSWRYIFEEQFPKMPKHVAVKWALPGAERQDSVFNGFQEISSSAELVAVHDSARPLVTPADSSKCLEDAWNVGAAVLGVPVKPTIKEVNGDLLVVKTLQRAKLWEVQTPQCIRPALLRKGFELVRSQSLEVTDDVSIIEALGEPVKITPGAYTNIKVTTPDDMSVAEGFLDEQRAVEQKAAKVAA